MYWKVTKEELTAQELTNRSSKRMTHKYQGCCSNVRRCFPSSHAYHPHPCHFVKRSIYHWALLGSNETRNFNDIVIIFQERTSLKTYWTFVALQFVMCFFKPKKPFMLRSLQSISSLQQLWRRWQHKVPAVEGQRIWAQIGTHLDCHEAGSSIQNLRTREMYFKYNR